jgi:hypothetical protein
MTNIILNKKNMNKPVKSIVYPTKNLNIYVTSFYGKGKLMV